MRHLRRHQRLQLNTIGSRKREPGANTMVAEVYAGLGAVKAAFDMAKGLKDINDAAIRNAAIIELQQKILGAQEEQATLIQRLRELEQELSNLKAWEEEKKRYELKELPPGVFVYELKQGIATSDPPHRICQTCYQRGKKSILHSDEPGNGIYHLTCYECGTQLRVGNFRGQSRANTRSSSSWAV
jgi:hypothetical protein